MRSLLFPAIILCSFFVQNSFSQSLSVNTTGVAANASSILDVSSTVKGVLIPRMSRTERNAVISPATGLMIFQSSPDSIGFYYYNGTAWTWMVSNSNADSLAWRTGGNSATVDANNFIGTKDNIPFNIRVNNQKAGRIDPTLFNSFFGYQSGIANTSGSQNTAYGKTSLYSNTIGINNTALGVQSLYFNINGNENTGLGPNALFYNSSGSGNVAAGLNTMFTNTSGNYNTALGYYALGLNSTGYSNVAVGVKSLYTNVSNGNLVAVGDSSMYFNTGVSNTAIGSKSLYTNSTGNNNTANGYRALYSNTTADDNTATGTDALFSNTSGAFNTANGFYALRNNTIGINNTAVGSTALYFNTTAGKNTAIGYQALYSQSFSNSNVAWNSENIAIGNEALFSNQPTATTNGYFNTAVGNQSLRTNSTGYQNTAFGNLSLFSNTTGQLNAASGWASLYKNDAGQYNSANGAMAMYYNTSGNYNVGLGALALHNNVTGSNNTVIGHQAGLGVLNNSYSNNTIVGNSAGYSLTTGSSNVFLGYQAGYTETTGSNKLYIANSSSNPPLIYGDFSTGRVGLGTISPGERLEITGNLKFSGTDTIYAGTGQFNMLIHSGDGTGSGGNITLRGGNAGISSGGAGGNINIQGGANLPSGGAGYGGLGVPGVVNILGSYGYNSVGGAINITAGATSCWSLVSGSHSDVNISGGQNLASTDASKIVLEGGYTIGTSCPSPGATGGNLLLTPGTASGTGTNGYIKLDGVIAYGITSIILAGGASGSPVSLLNQKSYVGLLPANATNNNYQLPSPVTYPGRMYIIRNNSSSFNAAITTAAGWFSLGSDNLNFGVYYLNPASSPKTVMAISDGTSWIMMKQD